MWQDISYEEWKMTSKYLCILDRDEEGGLLYIHYHTGQFYRTIPQIDRDTVFQIKF